MPSPRPPRFPVVGLGGSAGALEAFFAFFEGIDRLGERPGMAFVVVLHLPPDEDSHLVDLLRRRTRLPVRALGDGGEVEADVVHVVPPDATVAAGDGALRLCGREPGEGGHHPVDDLFAALAGAFGERAVAVVCSGTGSNGSAGIGKVHEAGGCTLAERPETAEFDEMPRRAIGTGLVDLVLAPGEMADALRRNARRLSRAAPDDDRGAGEPGAAGEDEKSGEDGASGEDALRPSDPMARILATLRARASLDFRQYKTGTLHRRVERRMELLRLDGLDRYAELLRERPEEVDALAHDLLITVTGFFRDEEAWRALAERALPRLVEGRSPDEPLRAWVAGCATGEEAYSVAIALHEAMQARGAGLRLEIFATDASKPALSRARHGVYPAAAVRHLSPERRERWFERRDDTVQASAELREAMIFAPQDLVQDPPFSRADLVVCRNVLIYLQPELQRRLIRLFHFALREGGVLFLGSAEGVGDAAELFETIDKPARLFRRLGPTRHDLVNFPVMRSGRARGIGPDAAPRPPADRAGGRPADRVLRALLDRHAPPAVLVDRALNVRWYQGATERFLRPQSGEATHSLLALARDGLAPPLRRVVEAARRSGEVETLRLRAPLEEGAVPLRIEAAPVPDDPGALLVSFLEDAPPPAPEPEDRTAASSRERELEEEVRALREEVAAQARDGARAEEESKAYNEEVTSMNEELRAANEELETSKEELQSLNEELGTVNTELRLRVDELGERTADLDNLLRSTDVATIFLDPELGIRWSSPRARDLFRIQESDAGRPLWHFARRFREPGLEEACRRVFQELEPEEAQVETEDGRVYTRRITPYRAGDRIAGVVVTLGDVTEIQVARRYAERIVETVPTPFLVLDPELRVVSANPAFYSTFAVPPGQTEGRLIYDLGNRQWDIPELRRLLDEVLPDNDHFEGYEVEHDFEGIGRKVMLLNGRRLDHVQSILLSVEDVTARRRGEERQAMLMAELAHRVKNALGVVQSLAAQTLRRSSSLEEFEAAFAGRLGAYAHSHGQLLTQDWGPGRLDQLVRASVELHAVDPERVQAEGPSVEVSPKRSLALGLVLHELETNAMKYGALSNEAGRVEVRWSLDGDGRIRLAWREIGGPPVSPPEREGFGSTLIRQLVSYELGGEAETAYEPEGLECRIAFAGGAARGGDRAAKP